MRPPHFSLSWFIWKLEPWDLAARRTNKKTEKLVYFCIRKKKPYGSQCACLYVSEIEKMRDGNGVVLECTSRDGEGRKRLTIFWAILVNFNVNTVKPCFTKGWTSCPHTVLHENENKMCTIFQIFSIWSFPKRDICFSYNCVVDFSANV